MTATSEHDLRECWLVPISDSAQDWVIIYDADYGTADGNLALGYAEFPEPTAVYLSNFDTVAAAATIEVIWSTNIEIDILGFNIYRSDAPNGQRDIRNETLIPASGEMLGAEYQFLDSKVAAGKEYFYWLEIVFINESKWFGPISNKALYAIYLPTTSKE